MAAVQFIALFIVLSILGMANTGYLFWKHRRKGPLICPLYHDCSVVTESKWSHIFYFRNETLGLLFYAFMLVGILASIFLPSPLFSARYTYRVLLLASGAGVLFSIFLVYVQVKIIRNYCFYCMVSALLTLLLFLNSILLNLG
ncbi:vitamin K epoxide reductase family protein [Candidatus Woesearchaeota archaeon]|nr:vitamin K epoxide reductase family protein [Candidatus Woesearchaeota archaeon]